MTRSDQKSGASPRVSVRQRRQQSITSVVTESTSGVLGDQTTVATPSVQEDSRRAERERATLAMGRLLAEALQLGQRAAQRQEDQESLRRAPSPNRQLADAIERSLLAAKNALTCIDCGRPSKHRLCDRCFKIVKL